MTRAWEIQTFSNGGVDHNLVAYDDFGERRRGLVAYIREPHEGFRDTYCLGSATMFTLIRYVREITEVTYFATLEAAKLAAEMLI